MTRTMKVCVVHCARLIITAVVAAALIVAGLESGIAQAQESSAHELSAAENDSAAEASKQAANPLASAWHAVRPQPNGPKWNVQLQITPILPALMGAK